jgi:uncharacterized protein
MEEAMIIIDKKTVANIPLLEVVKQEFIQEKCATVFFLHGFSSIKENNLHYAYLLAEKNIRVVLPDAMFHGDRSESLSIEKLAFHFWNIILKNIEELDQLKKAYIAHGWTAENKIGVAGTSMGGITTLGALTQYDWIKCAVSLMGNPCYDQFTRYLVEKVKEQGITLPLTESQLEEEYKKVSRFDLSKQPEKLKERPLLFWHGKKDPVVPYHYAYDFYQNMKELYSGHEEDLQFILDEHGEHKVSREGVLATVRWFDKYIH